MEHRLLHKSIAGTDGHTMTAGNATGFTDGLPTVPQNPRMGILPADGQSFVDLEVLAGLDATAAQNALVGIVTVERVRVINLVGLRFEGHALVFDAQHLRGVVYRAVAVIVVADGAIEKVIAQNT